MDDPAQRNEMVTFINAHNARNNLYFGVNPRHESMAGTTRATSNTDVVARQVVALDFDNKDALDVDLDSSRTLDALKGLNPVALVDTGNGPHLQFRIERIEGTGATSAATAQIDEAMKVLGADQTADLRRVMRLPYCELSHSLNRW
jgi:hypothetical protein